MSEDPASVVTLVEGIVDSRQPGVPSPVAEIDALRSGARRIEEADLSWPLKAELFASLAPRIRRAQLPEWALGAVLAEIAEPDPPPFLPLSFEQAQRRLRRQGLDECLVCRSAVASEMELDRLERCRRWAAEAAAVRARAVPTGEATGA